MNKPTVAVLIFCMASLLPAVAAADGMQIYKWTDRQGVVHYSDKAPANPQTTLQIMALPELPPADPKAEAADQAWITSIHQWYQNILKQQSELQYQEFLAWEESQPPAPPPAAGEQVSYVTPFCWDCARIHFHHRHFRRPLLSAPTPQSIQNSVWSTQPNAFNPSLWNTKPAPLGRPPDRP